MNHLIFFVNSGLAADEDSAPVIIYSTGKAGLPESEKTWAKHLQDAGYITQAIGKKITQRGNLWTFLPLRFYDKSILIIIEVQRLQFLDI